MAIRKPEHRDRVEFWTTLLLKILLAFAFCFTSTPTCSARIRAASHKAVPDDYISALATANHFLAAWQTHDHETLILLLTNAAKQGCSEERLDSFLSSSSPAYEVGRGRKLPDGRYAFPITIFSTSRSPDHRSIQPRHIELIVSRSGKNDWAVDKLP